MLKKLLSILVLCLPFVLLCQNNYCFDRTEWPTVHLEDLIFNCSDYETVF
ncbi:MAG: hypothetical protein ACJATI_002385 [Halioglobus sp.]|jgi:hypothetical protein